VRLLALGLLSLTAFWANGCAWIMAPPRDNAQARAILERLSRRNDRLHTSKGLLKVSIKTATATLSGRVAYAVALPDRVRMEWLDPLGQPLSSLVNNRGNLTIFTHQDHQLHRIENTRTALNTLIHIPMGIEDLVALLSGRPVLPDFSAAQVFEGAERSTILLKNRWHQTLSDLELDDQNQLIGQRVYDGQGGLRYSIQWERWQRIGDYCVPRRMNIASASGETVAITLERFWPDVDLAPSAFELNVPGSS
jgi:outer membrane lipoprotein-sorting protein